MRADVASGQSARVQGDEPLSPFRVWPLRRTDPFTRTSVSDLVGRLDVSSKLEHFVGSDRLAMDYLQGAISVLGPLVAAAVC